MVKTGKGAQEQVIIEKLQECVHMTEVYLGAYKMKWPDAM